MNAKTKSETIFQDFCIDLPIPCTPIPCEENQTPDYELRLNGHLVIAEIKQLDLNDDDEKNWSQARSRGAAAAWGGTEDRLRRKIKKANTQLKTRCNGDVPGIVVVYNNGAFGGIDETDVKEAMFGDETVTVSKFGGNLMNVSAIHAGGNARLNENTNTTVSALAILRGTGNNSTLSIFHNHYAANPFDPNWFRHERFKHFVLSQEFFNWVAN